MRQQGKWVFIVNPVAGNGHGLTLVDKIREMINRFSLDAEIVFTERRGHASELSEKYAREGFRYFIAVGGDGTYNEVATPLVGNKNVITGELPGGTANGVNEIAGFPDRFSDNDWEAFFMADAIPMDVGRCNGKTFFFTGIGIGFDVQVAKSFNELREVKSGGKHRYMYLVLKTILFYKEKRMTAITDGKRTETECFMNTVSSGARSYAKSFFLTPDTIANNGLFHVCAIMKLSVPQRLKILLTVPKGKHLKNKRVHYYKTPSLSLEFPEEVPFHADGEIFHTQRFDLGVIHEGVNLIYSPGGTHHFDVRQGSQAIN